MCVSGGLIVLVHVCAMCVSLSICEPMHSCVFGTGNVVCLCYVSPGMLLCDCVCLRVYAHMCVPAPMCSGVAASLGVCVKTSIFVWGRLCLCVPDSGRCVVPGCVASVCNSVVLCAHVCQ